MSESALLTRLSSALEGRYRIECEIGEGGMATVYLADDLRHDRKVALKVLKPELAAVVGSDRFLAEIKTTANLHHPHILALFDSGQADDFLFYVMPYVEGETLRDRLHREHQLPVDDAVRIATNVAEALEYAHAHGVIHRDIKPANILLQSGKPVVSDFGIALAVGAAGEDRLTETGLSLGTPHYMSPEQATGDRHVGPATDIYALGCVLYEMLVGEPPFTGSTPQAVLGKIIASRTPSARVERKTVPPNVEAVISRSLEKVAADRFTTADALGRALADRGFRHGTSVGSAVPSRGWRRIAIGSSTVAALLALSLALLLWPESEAPPPPLRFPNPFLEGQAPSPFDWMRLTPDGSALVYVGPTPAGDGRQLWTREWDNLEARPIPGTRFTRTISFAVSPDGRDVVFVPFEGDVHPLRIAPLGGGPSRPLPVSAFAVSAWTRDGMIYYHVGAGREVGTLRIAETGGTPDTVTVPRPGELHLQYVPLEGGDWGVVEVRRQDDPWAGSAELWIVEPGTDQRRLLTAGHSPRRTSVGQLLFVTSDGALMAAPIEGKGLVRADQVVVALENKLLMEPVLGIAPYDVSETGTLVYATGEGVGGRHEFIWLDRQGRITPVPSAPLFEPGGAANIGWKLSPDHGHVAFQRIVKGNTDIYTLALQSGAVSRLTFDPAIELAPRWSPDGSAVVFWSGRGFDNPSQGHLWSRPADGGGEAQPLVPQVNAVEGVWSPDGTWLVLRTAHVGAGGADILGLRPGTDTVPTPLVVSEDALEFSAEISPDGRWLAYQSDQSGRPEIYVRPFPNVSGGRWQVSSEGGSSPIWAHNGRELFFIDPASRSMMTADYRAGSTFEVLDRRALFAIPGGILTGTDTYDVAGDDDRFLMVRIRPGVVEGTQTVLVLNFLDERRLRSR